MLRERGKAIKHLKFSKLQKIDHKIDSFLQEGTTKEYIQIITCAFITFNTQNGFKEALAWSKQGTSYSSYENDEKPADILGFKPDWKQAPDPMNIYWECLHLSKW